jgi:arylsulfatase A-like enzyme
MMKNTLTRKDFLRVAGMGTAGITLLTTSAVNAGCSYLPSGGSNMNVILVIIDSLRKDHVGAYGNSWIKTPNLDSLARESMCFTRAYPESLPTICARRAIHTGIRTFPFRNYNPPAGETVSWYGWQPIPDSQRTLAEILRAQGFSTMFVTDTFLQFRPSYNFHRGFDAFHFIRGQQSDAYNPLSLCPERKLEQVLTEGPLRQYFANTIGREREEDWFAPQVFTKAAKLLDAAKEEQPFFFVVDNFDPHEPWDPPSEYVSLYDEGYDGPEPFVPIYGSSDYLTERELKRMRALYAGEVTMMDRWLGRLLEKINDLGLFENTLLIVLSDHGHALGEHGYVGKVPYALWPELTDILFFIRHPAGKSAGQTSDYYASTHDVAPTILGALGIEPASPMEGQDLSMFLDEGEPAPRKHFTVGFHDHVWTRDQRYVMFSRNDGSSAKLFDLQDDPQEDKNIAGDHPDIVQRLFNDYILKDAGGPLPNY